MAQPYVYRGDPRDYHWLGHVEDGSVAYFEGRPPDERWQPHEAEVAADADVVDELRAQQQDEATATADQNAELKQPNKAASADDWRAYAEAHGGFQDATGMSPTDPDVTRKAIVDHYTAPAGDQSQEQATPDAASAPTQTEQPAQPANTQE